jgi:putative Ca2+/H+ antiporter (TMEM165/GDT1 family)
MDWKIFLTTFATIFIAELGDKTQFAAFAASSSSKNTLSVLLAVVLALSVAGVIGVLAGRLVGEFIKPDTMRYVAGSAFILMGLWYLFKGS